MAKHKAPEWLVQCSTEAIRLGMSYGKYMALYHPVIETTLDKPAKREDGEKKACQFCGKEFTTRNRDRKYCSMECKEHADGKSRRDRKRAKTIPKPIVKTCLMCGKEFVAASYRNKYCGQFCASRAKAERSLEYCKNRKAKKEGDKSGGQIPGAAEKIARAEQVEAMCAF